MKSTLSQRLRAARLALHPTVTQKEIAKLLELSPSAVNLWEQGKTEPGAADIARLAHVYKVTTDWLLGVDAGKSMQKMPTGAPPVFTVPIVPVSALARWDLNASAERLQTTVLYPSGTAAAVLVTSDALRSTCPTGAYAIVSKAHGADNGQVVLASVARSPEPVIRTLVSEAGDKLLVADDVRFPTYRLEDGVQIIGRVTEVTIRKMLV